jgi:hypothetical protein
MFSKAKGLSGFKTLSEKVKFIAVILFKFSLKELKIVRYANKSFSNMADIRTRVRWIMEFVTQG